MTHFSDPSPLRKAEEMFIIPATQSADKNCAVDSQSQYEKTPGSAGANDFCYHFDEKVINKNENS